jgi:hypothetical protein
MNYWADTWDLDADQCPCDLHFNEWIADKRLTNSTIYHFGTGNHHVIGIDQAQNGSNNRVFGITASIDEYRNYIRLVTREPEIARSYLAYFGDVYLTNPALLPTFDVATLFHLCEFSKHKTADSGYRALTDFELLNVITDKVRPGGHLLFYTGSFAYDRANRILGDWRGAQPVVAVEPFKSLVVYRKSPT